jgi:predicted ATPase
MYIQKLTIENWKNFKRPGAVRLGHRLFLVGPNASGKSNLLDVFRFLRDLCVSGGGLQKAVETRGGVSAIRCLAASRVPYIVIDVELKEEDNTGGEWRYRISIKQDSSRRPILKEELIEHNGIVLLKRPDKDDFDDSLRLTETTLEERKANKEFRPIWDFFQTITYYHLLPQVMREPKKFSPDKVENDPYGRDFLQKVMNTPVKGKEARFKKILAALQVAVPQLESLKINRDNLGIPHLEGLYKHWRPNAGWQNEAQFSDGTLRLFGLLWSLFEGEGPLLMEEPELSLHPEVVRNIPQMIERINRLRKTRRQVIISTHSEEMLRDEGIGGGEVLRLEPGPDGSLLKSPLDDDEERTLLESGLSVADVVLPKSAPKNPEQLALCFDR